MHYMYKLYIDNLLIAVSDNEGEIMTCYNALRSDSDLLKLKYNDQLLNVELITDTDYYKEDLL